MQRFSKVDMGDSAVLVAFGLLIVLSGRTYGEISESISNIRPYPSTDPRRCLAEPGIQSTKPDIRFEVLPGIGFDNLRNVDAGQVSLWTYNDCKTTEDGRYLNPDSVFTIPVKASSLEIFAEVFQHWSSYTSATSNSINVDAGGGFAGFGISGKFSKEFENVKTHQVEEKSVTTRVQIRHVFYTAKLQPDSPLHPTFKDRLMNIAAHLQNNNTAVARYLSQLLVRDYGTHVVTSVDAGAALVKEDQIKNTFLNNTENSKSKISASASASFFSFVHFDTGYSSKDSEASEEQYMGNLTRSKIRTHGGPSFQSNFTVNMWEEGLRNDLVAIDRAGDPLHFFVTTATLPELPDPTIRDLAELVKISVELYYKFNTYAGCTKQDSPNFSFQANLDDGSCKPPETNFTFGGVYQTCKEISSYAGSLCPDISQKNPQSGDFACPTDYKSVLLHSGTAGKTITRWVCNRVCRKCGWWSRCCHDECGDRRYSSSASYSAYWCAAVGEVPQNSGYLFGGLYTSRMANPVTETKSCPLNFFQLRLGADLHVCVSDDYELGSKYSLPFAGFFSCVSGNPLSTASASPVSLRRSASGGTEDSQMLPLQQFMMDAGPEAWPKSCPQGFSQHLAVIDESCEINYCVRMGALNGQGLPKIRLPPFCPQPSDNPNSTNTVMVYGVSGKIWVKSNTSGTWIRIDGINDGSMQSIPSEYRDLSPSSDAGQSTESNPGLDLSPGGAAGIAVTATVVCGVLVLVIVIRVRARRARKRGHGNQSTSTLHGCDNTAHETPSYGSVSENAC